MHASSPDPFDYAALPPHPDFATLSQPGAFTPLPDSWCVGVADIQGSTKAIAAGRYKTVNMVAAAVISAQLNAHRGAPFPFIFGGDGAGFAVPPGWATQAGDALAAVRVWAREAFDLELRVTLLTVADIRAAGQDVTVARFQAAPGVDYAMFSGGGLSWAEARMKAGETRLAEAPPGTEPDLTGLSCRWSHMPSRHGQILSLVVVPADTRPGAGYEALVGQIAALAGTLERAGTPVPAIGPGVSWPPAGADIEAHALPSARPLPARRLQVLLESFIAWVLIRTGVRLGGFDARRYRRVVGANADFRKVEDGLKMTLDCDPATDAQLVALLERGAAEGLIRYGLHRQDAAMMTCIVPSMMSDDHVHFVDGAEGGYTAAASRLKHSAQPG